MAEQGNTRGNGSVANNSKRVKQIKRSIVAFLVFLVFMSIVLNIILLMKINILEKRIEDIYSYNYTSESHIDV